MKNSLSTSWLWGMRGVKLNRSSTSPSVSVSILPPIQLGYTVLRPYTLIVWRVLSWKVFYWYRYCTGCSSTEPAVLCCTVRYCTVLCCMCNLWGKLGSRNEESVRTTRSCADSLNLRLQASRLKKIRNLFSYRVVEAWNSIPSEIKNLKTVHTF